MGNYPSHRNNWPVIWLARADATIDDPPLPPKVAARTRAIRGVFLHQLQGYASIDAVWAACDHLGLLDGLSTPGSARETVMAALRPIATSNVWESVHRPAYSPPPPPGEPGVR